MRTQFLVFLFLLLSSCGTKVFQNIVIIDLSKSQFADGTISVFDHRMGDGKDWVLKQGLSVDGQKSLEFKFPSLRTVMIGDSGLPEKLSFGLFIQPLSEDGFFAIEIDGKLGANELTKNTFIPYWGRKPTLVPELKASHKVSKMEEGWKVEVFLDGVLRLKK